VAEKVTAGLAKNITRFIIVIYQLTVQSLGSDPTLQFLRLVSGMRKYDRGLTQILHADLQPHCTSLTNSADRLTLKDVTVFAPRRHHR